MCCVTDHIRIMYKQLTEGSYVLIGELEQYKGNIFYTSHLSGVNEWTLKTILYHYHRKNFRNMSSTFQKTYQNMENFIDIKLKRRKSKY